MIFILIERVCIYAHVCIMVGMNACTHKCEHILWLE